VNTDATDPVPSPPGRTDHLRCVGYAIRTLLRVLPALGRNSDHRNPPPGLSVKHFVIGGVISAAVLVGSIIGIVNIVLRLALAK